MEGREQKPLHQVGIHDMGQLYGSIGVDRAAGHGSAPGLGRTLAGYHT